MATMLTFSATWILVPSFDTFLTNQSTSADAFLTNQNTSADAMLPSRRIQAAHISILMLTPHPPFACPGAGGDVRLSVSHALNINASVTRPHVRRKFLSKTVPLEPGLPSWPFSGLCIISMAFHHCLAACDRIVTGETCALLAFEQ